MSAAFNNAFILAAGTGTRMRPFTTHTPKPMANVGGETLIRRIIHQCRDSGANNIVANSYHLAETLEAHVPDITVLREEVLLNTGYGIKRALPYFHGEPFYAISGDSWWTGDVPSVFEQMDAAWNNDIDLLLVLQRIDGMTVTKGTGDYHFENGVPRRALDKNGTHIWTSLRLCGPHLFEDTPDEPFSFLMLMDRAEAQGRLGAIELNGTWQHLTDMDDVDSVNAWLAKS